MMKSVFVLAIFASVNAFASTAPEAAAVLDSSREGTLRQLVIEEFIKNNKEECDVNEVAR